MWIGYGDVPSPESRIVGVIAVNILACSEGFGLNDAFSAHIAHWSSGVEAYFADFFGSEANLVREIPKDESALSGRNERAVAGEHHAVRR